MLSYFLFTKYNQRIIYILRCFYTTNLCRNRYYYDVEIKYNFDKFERKSKIYLLDCKTTI